MYYIALVRDNFVVNKMSVVSHNNKIIKRLKLLEPVHNREKYLMPENTSDFSK